MSNHQGKICIPRYCHHQCSCIKASLCLWPVEKYMLCLTKHSVAQKLVTSKFCKKISTGLDYFSWHDVWVGPSPLKSAFRRLFSLAALSNCTIVSMGLWDGLRWSRAFSWIRPLRNCDKLEKENLIILLESVSLSQSGLDCMVRMPSKSGEFSVKFASLELAKSASLHLSESVRGLWHGLVPTQIDIFFLGSPYENNQYSSEVMPY